MTKQEHGFIPAPCTLRNGVDCANHDGRCVFQTLDSKCLPAVLCAAQETDVKDGEE